MPFPAVKVCLERGHSARSGGTSPGFGGAGTWDGGRNQASERLAGLPTARPNSVWGVVGRDARQVLGRDCGILDRWAGKPSGRRAHRLPSWRKLSPSPCGRGPGGGVNPHRLCPKTPPPRPPPARGGGGFSPTARSSHSAAWTPPPERDYPAPNSARIAAECSPIDGTGPNARTPSLVMTGGAAMSTTPFGVSTAARRNAGW